MKDLKKKRWSDYLWIAELCYLFLGLFNILFAWLGMLFFCIPLLVAIFGGSKAYCNRYCGRGQLFGLLGEKLKLSRNVAPPKFLRSPWFRYGFLAFFMVMFGLMLFSTYRVFTGAPLSQTVTASVGIQTSVAVGGCELRDTVDRAICFWIFRRYADLDRSGLGENGVVPPKIVVCILPHGDDDAGHLQIEEWKEGKRIWKPRQRT